MARFADAAHDFADDLINTVVRILQRVGGDQDPRQVRLLKQCLRPAAGCVLQRFQGKPEIAAVCGVRRKGTRWNDHRHVNRSGKRRQRRWVIGDPIGGRRRQRNPFGRFHAFAGTLSRDLHLKDRLAVESGMLKSQRDVFLTEMMGDVVCVPVVLIVEPSGELVGAPPGIAAAVVIA